MYQCKCCVVLSARGHVELQINQFPLTLAVRDRKVSLNDNGAQMRTVLSLSLTCVFALTGAISAAHLTGPPIQRVGIVIGIRPDKLSAYEALHAASNPGVRDLLAKYHIHNFSIFVRQLDDGRYYEFGYYEYSGSDYKSDMDKLAKEPGNQEWLRLTDPMQVPLSGERTWSTMQEIYHNP
jgi:L-rhamnose mutarotase